MIKASEVVESSIEFLSDPDRWSKGADARTVSGDETNKALLKYGIYSRCIGYTFFKYCNEDKIFNAGLLLYFTAFLQNKSLAKVSIDYIVNWNDFNGTTHKIMINKLKEFKDHLIERNL